MAPFLVARPAAREQTPQPRRAAWAAIARDLREVWSMTPLSIVLRALTRKS